MFRPKVLEPEVPTVRSLTAYQTGSGGLATLSPFRYLNIIKQRDFEFGLCQRRGGCYRKPHMQPFGGTVGLSGATLLR
jgi:hypothetical protein